MLDAVMEIDNNRLPNGFNGTTTHLCGKALESDETIHNEVQEALSNLQHEVQQAFKNSTHELECLQKRHASNLERVVQKWRSRFPQKKSITCTPNSSVQTSQGKEVEKSADAKEVVEPYLAWQSAGKRRGTSPRITATGTLPSLPVNVPGSIESSNDGALSSSSLDDTVAVVPGCPSDSESTSLRESHGNQLGLTAVVSAQTALQRVRKRLASSPRDGRHRSNRLSTRSTISTLRQNTDETSLAVRTRTYLQWVVRSTAFSIFSLAAILANIVLVGYSTEHNMQRELFNLGVQQIAHPGSDRLHMMVEFCFCWYFALELALRMAADGKQFLDGGERNWNMFDLLLVASCVLDFFTDSFGSLRILRPFRMMRVLRIIRVMRFFRSFRILVYSIVQSLGSLVWIFVLLLFVLYAFAISILQLVQLEFAGHVRSQIDTDKLDFVAANFSTVGRSLANLFMAISGGRDWKELIIPLHGISFLCAIVFSLYIFFVVFGMLNIVTGAFVESLTVVSRRDYDVASEEELKKTLTFKKDVQTMFEDADADNSGTLSWEEFQEHLEDERIVAYFKSLNLDISQAKALYVLLDLEEQNEVPIDRFIEGCTRMRGDAKSIDVNMLLWGNEKLLGAVTSFIEYTESQFTEIHGILSNMRPAPHGTPAMMTPISVPEKAVVKDGGISVSAKSAFYHKQKSCLSVKELQRQRTMNFEQMKQMLAPVSRLDSSLNVISSLAKAEECMS